MVGLNGKTTDRDTLICCDTGSPDELSPRGQVAVFDASDAERATLDQAYDAFYGHAEPQLSEKHLDLLADDMTAQIVSCEAGGGEAGGTPATPVIGDDVDLLIDGDGVVAILPSLTDARTLPPPSQLAHIHLNEGQTLALNHAIGFLQAHMESGNEVAARFARELVREFNLTALKPVR